MVHKGIYPDPGSSEKRPKSKGLKDVSDVSCIVENNVPSEKAMEVQVSASLQKQTKGSGIPLKPVIAGVCAQVCTNSLEMLTFALCLEGNCNGSGISFALWVN